MFHFTFVQEIARRIYRLIFKREPGDLFFNITKNLAISGVGTGVAGIFLFISTLIAGRVLGPAEYGQAGVVLSYGSLLLLFLGPGLNTGAVRYLANASDNAVRSQIVTVVTTMTFIITGVVSAIFLYIYPNIAVYFHVDALLLLLAFPYAITVTLKNLFDSFVRGLHLFADQLRARVFEAVTVLLSIIALVVLLNYRFFSAYIISLSVGAVIYTLFIFFTSPIFFGKFSINMCKKILFYSLFAGLGGFAGFLFLSLNRIILSHTVEESLLGVYMAYYTATFTFGSQLLVIYNNVFFPTISQFSSKKVFLKKINKLNLVLALPLVFFICMCAYVFLRFYGDAYVLRYDWLLLGSVAAVCNFFYLIDIWITAAQGKKGIVLTSSITFLVGIVNSYCMYIFSRIYGVTGALVVNLCISVLLLCIYKVVNKFLYRYEHQ